MVAAGTPAEFPVGTHLEALSQALCQGLLDAGRHRYLDHSHTVPAIGSRRGPAWSRPAPPSCRQWPFLHDRLHHERRVEALDAREVGQRVIVEALVSGEVDRDYAQ